MNFNHKDVGNSLRRKFAGAADAQDMLQKVAFEESMTDRHGDGKPSFVQQVLYVLDQNVPNIKPDVLTAAIMLPLPRGMVNEHGALEDISKAAKDLYLLMTRAQNPALSATQSPGAAQLAMAFKIVQAEQIEEARQTQNVPFGNVMHFAQEVKMLKAMLDSGAAKSGAPQLDKLFSDTAARIEKSANDFFNAPLPSQKPPRP